MGLMTELGFYVILENRQKIFRSPRKTFRPRIQPVISVMTASVKTAMRSSSAMAATLLSTKVNTGFLYTTKQAHVAIISLTNFIRLAL